jgi:bifunctional non-homologous end joining protein LigD
VSAPCTWDEVESGAAGPRTFTLRTMVTRLAAKGDLWAGVFEKRQALPALA